VAVGQAGAPLLGNALLSIEGSGELAIDGTCCISIVAQIDGQETSFSKRIAVVESPECGF
jgi:hypothetical protein